MRILLLFLFILLSGCGGGNSDKTVDSGTDEGLPVANAGHSMQLQRGATVVLNGSGSYDPNGGALTYSWSIVSAPPGSASALSDTSSPFPSLFLDEAGSYEVTLVVSNGDKESKPSSVIISDTDSMPIANAGPDRRVSGNQPVMLTVAEVQIVMVTNSLINGRSSLVQRTAMPRLQMQIALMRY